MSTMMAEQRVELRHTKTELGAMEARLRDSESRLTDSESRLTDSESHLAASERQLTDSESRLTDSESRLTDSESRLAANERQLTDSESRLTASESQVEELSKMNEAQAVKLNSMETRSNITESHVEVLKRNSQDRKVAFSASLAAPGQGGNTGPFNTGITLVYRHIYSNIGNAYNPTTGIFTAPVRGLYLFRFYIYGGGDSSVPTTTFLQKNGHQIATAHAHQSSGGINSSNGVSLLLEVGDVVYMYLWAKNKIYDSEYHHSTFSGHLLFTM
ncbi:uncharacterized protein LOC116358550 [Oncorhynchus kisutch]|uniref:Uncharacterized LOC116358550 n=1 Tax=Oncorhynchus kisutch TaxID=8019 RepID=A0A8C7I200_ONCKI|nr:uncharacterized protein LOC116358550 [Oncorhynchus kisutch]